jgi:hypothetical protein
MHQPKNSRQPPWDCGKSYNGQIIYGIEARESLARHLRPAYSSEPSLPARALAHCLYQGGAQCIAGGLAGHQEKA